MVHLHYFFLKLILLTRSAILSIAFRAATLENRFRSINLLLMICLEMWLSSAEFIFGSISLAEYLGYLLAILLILSSVIFVFLGRTERYLSEEVPVSLNLWAVQLAEDIEIYFIRFEDSDGPSPARWRPIINLSFESQIIFYPFSDNFFLLIFYVLHKLHKCINKN